MPSFAESAAAFISSRPDSASRQSAWDTFERHGLPTASDEVWRYAPLKELSLDSFEVPVGASGAPESAFARALGERAGLVVKVSDGFVVELGAPPDGVAVESVDTGESLAGVALGPATTVIRVADGVTVDQPLVVRHVVGSTSAFPRTVVDLARGASATVVEYFEGGAGALVVPLSEFRLGPDSALHLITYQRLDHSAWHVARSTAFVQRDARMLQAVLGMGSHYDRSRNDAELMEAGTQVHDFRTRQYHVGARSRSPLLSKGAVAGSSRSVYTGLIEIEKGAKRTDARQTNHNLLLSPTAHADSVPNMDIRENDVMCAHASSVGPLDELQLWYLESRGVEPDEAERLIIQGFFTEMLTELPRELADLVEADVSESLSRVRSA